MKENLHGFVPVRAREFAELGGTLREYVHEKTGARLCWLDRPDENKSFSIAFKTLPEDSTGVFHILEHSVLCGSDKYPVKEPFVELLKSSVQTFLNAMTYPDKTVYPVSSRNDRDLLNLMDVYLDAVFHPAIYRKPEIFRQEGWRFEREGEGFCRQGVVLNEMKGAYADPGRIMEAELYALLFPDNCYGFESGGDPACIPDLSYEQFLAMHRKYYHPSNARISLVGSVDLAACLEKLDDFLSPYERQDCPFDIPMQQPGPARRRSLPYAIGPDEDPAQRTVVACGTLAARFDEDLRNDALSVLADYLTGDDDAPLKRAVLDAGLAQDFSLELEDGIQQSIVYWNAWNTDPDKQPALERTVRETLTRLTEQGLDRERLEACFRRYAFELRDRDSGSVPRSLSEALDMLDSWLYDGDPAQGLLAEQAVAELEQALQTDYPERLLRELFLENEHTVTVTLIPSATLGAEQAQAEQARVQALTGAWSPEELAAQDARAEALRLWQQSPDSEEALAAIPMLRLSDLAENPEPLRYSVSDLAGTPLLRHSTGSRLLFLRAHFEASDLRLEELPEFSLLCKLLGSMGTARYDRARLPLEIKSTTGRVSFAPGVLEGEEPDRCRILLSAGLACLPEQGSRAAALLAEILSATVWEDLELLRDNLQQFSINATMSLASSGHRFALGRVASDLTAHGLAQEYVGGVESVAWLKKTAAGDDESLRALLGRMGALARRLVTRERLTISVNETASPELAEAFRAAIPASGQAKPGPAFYPLPGARREGVVIPAAVGFAAMGSSLRRQGRRYSGSYPVLANVLNYTYLWNEIRVQGGAYGCGFGARSNGDMFYYSYRDPQPVRSLEVMRNAPAYLRAFCREEPDLTGFILGSVSAMDPLRGAEARMTAGDSRWLRGVSEEEVRRHYRELIHTDAAALLALAPALEELAAENALCVVAGKPLLEACGEALQTMISV
ncbi:MAG: insulinase family protein [Oscillospiraceae bacterium]|nr:insulinase family protein [Oscillospiraceae bacterium]